MQCDQMRGHTAFKLQMGGVKQWDQIRDSAAFSLKKEL